MYTEFSPDDIMDITEDVENDIVEPTDTSDEIDDILSGMSLDELYELRDVLSGNDVSDTEDEIPDFSDLTPINVEEPSDYGFHWDGGPTHNTDLDDDPEPTSYTKKLTR